MVGCDDVQGSVMVFPPANMGGEGLAQCAVFGKNSDVYILGEGGGERCRRD